LLPSEHRVRSSSCYTTIWLVWGDHILTAADVCPRPPHEYLVTNLGLEPPAIPGTELRCGERFDPSFPLSSCRGFSTEVNRAIGQKWRQCSAPLRRTPLGSPPAISGPIFLGPARGTASDRSESASFHYYRSMMEGSLIAPVVASRTRAVDRLLPTHFMHA
jgi:hypothetical protein